MAFFLIGRTPDNELHLLAPTTYASRQDAMAELSRLTADPSYGAWDSDVFVMDLDSGVPVLLVRPAMSPVAQESEPFVAEEPESIATEPLVAEEPALETPAPEQEPVAAEEPVGDAAIAEAIAAESVSDEEPALLPMEEPPAPPLPEPSPEEEFREALVRTAQQMGAEGIVVPPSAGIEPQPTETIGGSAEPTPEEPAETAAPAVTTSWPWDVETHDAEQSPDVASGIASVYSALEEPTTESVEPAGESDFILDLDEIQSATVEAEPAELSEADSPAVQTPLEETAPVVAEASVIASSAPEVEPVPSLEDYTCQDCVYVETCPKRDQLLPKDCGSFQWR